MRAALRLGLSELRLRWGLAFPMALVFGVAMLAHLALRGYTRSLQQDYPDALQGLLVVQESQSLGELYGSRLPQAFGERLIAMGASYAIPEIHTIVGTSPEDAVLLRGIAPADYQAIEAYELLAGRPLAPGDPARLAMIGYRLAESRAVGPGDTLNLRGRPFQVVGVFRTGAYTDNEAWISISDAQALLGWEGEVSVFVIPDEGVLLEGQTLEGGISVGRRGELGSTLPRQWGPILRLFDDVARLLGLAAGLILANALWRLAWLRRRELAILRGMGFRSSALAGYLFVQAAGVSILGAALGFAGTLALGALARVEVTGISLRPSLGAGTALASLAWVGLVAAAGAGLPAWWVSTLNLGELLRNE